MSFASLLEVANVQNDVGPIADAIAMEIDFLRLHASSEIINNHAVKIAIEHASAEEAVALIGIVLDTASVSTDNLTVVESACGGCAVVIFNDDSDAIARDLETAGVILDTAAPIDQDDDEDDDDPEDLHVVDQDVDIGNEEDDEEDDVPQGDPTRMQIANQDDVFKMLSRLHNIACGDDKADFPHFVLEMDKLLTKYRNISGFNPNAGQEQASTSEYSALDIFYELAKKSKKGYSEGRSGFLSAVNRIISKRIDNGIDAWDALDSAGIVSFMSDVGADLLDMIEAERLRRGMSDETPDQVNAETAPKDAATAKVIVNA